MNMLKNCPVTIPYTVQIITPTPRIMKAPMSPFLNHALAFSTLVGSEPDFKYITPATTIVIIAKIIPATIKKFVKGMRIRSLIFIAVKPAPNGPEVGSGGKL